MLGFDKNLIGEKATAAGKPVDSLSKRIGSFFGFDGLFLPEGGKLSEATSMGMGGWLSRPMAYAHDGFMNSIGAYETVNGVLYAKDLGFAMNVLVHDITNYASLFSIELAIQRSATILGEKLEAKMGYSETAGLVRGTFSAPIGIWTSVEAIYNQGKAAGG